MKLRRDRVVLRTSITMTAAAVAAVTALAACGPVQMGAAAITGNESISTAALSKQVDNLEQVYKASHGSIQLRFAQSQIPQQVLAWMVRFRVRDQLAVRNHITVTPAESQQALDATRAQIQASGGTLQDAAVANGLPPDLLPELGRYQAIQKQLVDRMDGGKLPTSTSALQALGQRFTHSECLAAKSLSIKVNPQYGRLDYSTLSIAAAPETLSAPQGGLPSPSPVPQSSPAC